MVPASSNSFSSKVPSMPTARDLDFQVPDFKPAPWRFLVRNASASRFSAALLVFLVARFFEPFSLAAALDFCFPIQKDFSYKTKILKIIVIIIVALQAFEMASYKLL